MSEGSRSIVSVGWLAAHQNDPDIVVADVRWYLPTTGRNGREEYETDHVPGAVFVDLERDLAVPGGPGHGRHPLPPVDAFAAALGALGIGNRSHVIAYDDAAGSTAARLWWMLRQVGHRRVSVLDGGLSAWRATGYPVTADVPEFAPTTFIPDMRHGLVASRSDVDDARSSPGSVVIDARARERFEGRVEPI
ncbi:MAG: rhodanese-like domain-containing protein, partial [Chloroflexi bacterium]|nr:rhodanese-like domain-containing protein [Chloroflexota bacterium]